MLQAMWLQRVGHNLATEQQLQILSDISSFIGFFFWWQGKFLSFIYNYLKYRKQHWDWLETGF